ncbi:TonB-dependent receptor [Jannaschia sp. Os4]|uniref:TonB-dependent receptor n=1 Tax=Jannaschia sp. Os4 TaxID=2807617 RepID=UPI00193A6DE8|nr:TonB-dependent receptor [Jannaschia sp. Os4]MBM2578012.1 TonB-dependent receptor [Jannaschia sp. Os4]
MRLTTISAVSVLALLASQAAAQEDTGFLISIDGEAVAGDGSLEGIVPRAPLDAAGTGLAPVDVALAEAEVRVRFDGLASDRVLALEVLDAPARPQAGDAVRVAARTNYPAYLAGAEVVVVGRDGRGSRTLARTPIDPNGEAVVRLPRGEGLGVMLRVRDARGRIDETVVVPLDPLGPVDVPEVGVAGVDVESPFDGTVLDGPFRDGLGARRGRLDGPRVDGTPTAAALGDMAARRRIPVNGGTVTVSGSNVVPGATVSVLGETVRPDADGRFVVSRILPPGEVPVDVRVVGPNQRTVLERQVLIPRAEWFGVGVVDVTVGRRAGDLSLPGGGEADRTWDRGRIAGYGTGRTASGWRLTGRVDTGEEELSDLFDQRDDQDAASLLDRIDREEQGYGEFGDDSLIEDGAPSRGKTYLHAERNGSSLTWGDWQATVGGNRFLRNERTLYGARGVYVSPDMTSRGDPRVAVELYAASPERLPRRDVFRGTGGSVYFLSEQDIHLASETVTLEIRDPVTDRVLETRRLTEGRDYDFNAVQGIVTLDRPLSSSLGGGTVVTTPGGEAVVNLVVQYEFTPTAGDIDGYAWGGRAEMWATDDLRLGVVGLAEDTGTADQTAYGADLLWRLGEASFVALDYARSEGPGFGFRTSVDGGGTFDTTAAVGGDGEAAAVNLDLDFADLGLAAEGGLSFYRERRTAGFSSLDRQVTVDEDLWGGAVEWAPSERLAFRLYADVLEDDAGREASEAGIEASYALNARDRLDLGVEYVERRGETATTATSRDEDGDRTDVALRFTRAASDDLTWWVFGQVTADRSGDFRPNHRAGVGADWALNEQWRLAAELSGGARGPGGDVILRYDNGAGTTSYAGWRLDPGRAFDGVALSGDDRGTFVAGGTRTLGEGVDLWAESTYDLFGRRRALTQGYGVDWRANDNLTFTAAAELGEVRDRSPFGGDIERRALSLGVRWDEGEDLQARARLELRRDRGLDEGVSQDQDAVLLTADAQWRIDDARRLRFNLEYADIESAANLLPEGSYAEAGLGYALRPTLDDRFNLLFQYRYVRDLVGQQVDGVAGQGPRQESHVLSVDGEYDLNERWSLGAKFGGRWSETSPDGTSPFEDNDAWLAVVNTRWHVTHKWDALLEARRLEADQAGFSDTGVLGAVYRHVGRNAKIGLGYNFGSFSDDLTDLTADDRGVFVNVIAKF